MKKYRGNFQKNKNKQNGIKMEKKMAEKLQIDKGKIINEKTFKKKKEKEIMKK